jgi:biotin-(acetyl-CoA carboxylase) ligase
MCVFSEWWPIVMNLAITRTQKRAHQNKKQTPTKAMKMHVGEEQTKGRTLM